MAIHVSARRDGGALRCAVTSGRHTLVTDEPESAGGSDTAMTPHTLLPAALASCVSTTILMYAARKNWDLGDAQVDVDYEAEGPRFAVTLHLPPGLDDDQRKRILRVAAKCPVQRTLAQDIAVEHTVAAARNGRRTS